MKLLFLILAVLGTHFSAAKVKANVFRRREPIENHYCKVQEPEFSYIFDFTKLTDENQDLIIKHETNDFLKFQLCRQLKDKCNGIDGYSICLSKHGNEIGVGKEPPLVLKEFGQIIFKYTGDKCDNSHNYSVNIKMICDYSIKDRDGVALYATGYNDCTYHIDWRTQAACDNSDRKQIKCNLKHESGYYDLSELINLSNNYKIIVDDRYSIILNICHSILYGQNTCKANNGACLVDKESSSSSKPLGEPQENLSYNSDGTLSLTYMDGGICKYEGGRNHMETKITFICDLDAIGTLPQYEGGMEFCSYNITWRTAVACSQEALRQKSLKINKNEDCILKDPLKKVTYNLTDLKNKEYNVTLPGTNEVYKFSVCGPLINSTCKIGTGACKKHNSISGGMGNSHLLWKEGGIYLNYTNGDLCYPKKQQRYTIIEFYCGPEDTEIEENDLCYDNIKISTNLVCNIENKNCATLGNEVNFEKLIQNNANYVVKNENIEYHINICHSLNPEIGLNCTNGEGICKTTVSNGNRINTTNLGYPENSVILSSDKKSATLMYYNGSSCAEDNKKRIKSNITFLCDANSYQNSLKQNNLTFSSYKNCTYYFEWKTSIMCREIDGSFNENFISNELGDNRDLSVLFQEIGPVIPIQNKKGDKTYKMALYGNKNSCNGAFVCDEFMNYGTKVNVLYNYPWDFIRFYFTDGSRCSNGSTAQSSITILCKDSYLTGEPVVLWEKPCSVEFEWRTNKLCKSENILRNEIIAANKSTLLNVVEKIGIVFVILVILAALYIVYKNWFICKNSTTRTCNHVKYSRVNTTEEVHLLLNATDPTVINSDSDDDDDELLEA